TVVPLGTGLGVCEIGGSVTDRSVLGGAPTAIVTVPTLVPPCPSLAVYVKLSSPLKVLLGVYVDEPSALTVAVPFARLVVLGAVSWWPSGSVSLASTPGAVTASWVLKFVV